MNEMAEAVMRQMGRCAESMRVDRRDWTTAQWVEDARRLMDEPDGAVTSLVNGHVTRLFAALDSAFEQLWERTEQVAALEAKNAQLRAVTDALEEYLAAQGCPDEASTREDLNRALRALRDRDNGCSCRPDEEDHHCVVHGTDPNE